jgi:hypothetical protein
MVSKVRLIVIYRTLSRAAACPWRDGRAISETIGGMTAALEMCIAAFVSAEVVCPHDRQQKWLWVVDGCPVPYARTHCIADWYRPD